MHDSVSEAGEPAGSLIPAPCTDAHLDLTVETPTVAALDTSAEFSRIAVGLDLTGFTGLAYPARGPASMAITFTIVVIAGAILAAVFVPMIVLSPDATNTTRAFAAGLTSGLVLCSGAVALLWLRRRTRR